MTIQRKQECNDLSGPACCDCPEPCACYAGGYAAGKDKAYFESEIALEDDTHAAAAAGGPVGSSRLC